MKNLLYIFCCFYLTTSFAQQIVTRELDAFDQISVTNACGVYFYASDKNQVVIETKNVGDARFVETKLSNSKLVINISYKTPKGFDLTKVKIKVYGNKLAKINLKSGAAFQFDTTYKTSKLAIVLQGANALNLGSGITVDFFELEQNNATAVKGIITANDVQIKMTSSAALSATIDAEKFDLNMSNASMATLKGSVTNFKANVNKSSVLKAFDLKTKNAHLTSNDVSVLNCWVTDNLSAFAYSTSQIQIKGSPKVIELETKNTAVIQNQNGQSYSNSF